MLGKYFDIGGTYMYYIEGIQDEKYIAWRTLKEYIDQPGIHISEMISKDVLDQAIESGEIREIDPPTFYIITKRDTYSIKKEIKSAGGCWSSSNKFWYFNEEPNINYTYKECLVFPFTGKRL